MSAEDEVRFLSKCGIPTQQARRIVDGLRAASEDELYDMFQSMFKGKSFEILWRLNRLTSRRVGVLTEALMNARDEIDRWGHGDMHYGPMPRDPGVVSALASIDEVLGNGREDGQ